jgi:hypothetical protein
MMYPRRVPHFRVASHRAIAAMVAAVAAVAGCTQPAVTGMPGNRPPGSGPAPGGGGNGPGSSADASFVLPDGGADLPPGPGTSNPVGSEPCAETSKQAEQVPVDLLLLVDSSGSMAQQSGTSTKWALATEALRGFVMDPRSSGLGLGLGFFPRLPPDKACTSNAQCGGTTPLGGDTCVQQHVCGKGGVALPLSGPECDDPLDECEDPTHTCLPVGTCAMTGAGCLGIGMPCPGGMAGDTCNARPRICDVTSSAWCNQPYDQAMVAISALPANTQPLISALTSQRPFGGTPLGPALRGGIAQMTAHQMANPGRRVAIVLVSDGLPDGFCGGNFDTAIIDAVGAARMRTPSIPSYVIGVFSPADIPRAQPVMQRLATAGGTGQPFILMTSSDLGQRFQEALNQIRGTALACEFTIPPSMGAIDFGKVNVHWKGASAEEDLLYVGSADRCDPARGGWYFDVDPATGGTPRRVLVCEASCNRFKSDAAAKVELRFGCKTRAID